jgi:hypothetical protein
MRSFVHQSHERVTIRTEVNGIIMTTDANVAVVGPGTFQFEVVNEGFSLRKQSTIDVSEVFVHKDTFSNRLSQVTLFQQEAGPKDFIT